jgi:cob(I)alamin adenosyltransferase
MSDRTDPRSPPDDVPVTKTGRRAPRPKQKRPGPYKVPPRDRRHGLLIVNTGDGKGKSTAAFGVLLRAWGRGMTVGGFQFVKSAVNPYGEHHAARAMGFDLIPLGDGFTWLSENLSDDRRLAEEGWARCRAVLAEGRFDVLLLDELTYPLNFGWLDLSQVLADLSARPAGTHVIVTGRDAPAALVEAADLVTEMRAIKHPYREQGLGAQPGIEL